MKRLFCVLGLLLAVTAAALNAQQGPTPEMRARLSGFARAFTSFDPKSPETIDKLREEAFSPDFKKRLSVEQLRKMATQLRADFGAYRIGEIRRNEETTVILMVNGEKDKGRIILGVDPAPPHLITSIAVEIGDGEDEAGPAPEINGTMTAPELSSTVDGFFAERAARDEFSGVVLIAKDGVPVVQKAYGYARREEKKPNTLTTRFNIGSINKAFTKAAIGQLMAKGKVALTDTIGKILPDYPNKDAHGATVDQLLNHTAGIANIFSPAFDAAPKDNFRSNADYFNFVAPMPLTFAPGTNRRYCNGCYVVLGQIVEKLSGMTYEDYVAKNIFEPAGMRTAGALDDSAPDVAMGYIRQDGNLRPNRDTRGTRGSAAGGGYATAADLLAFDTALKGGRLLDQKTMEWYGVGGLGIAGGAPGLNAVLEGGGEWTVVIVSNFDPPSAQQYGPSIARRLRQ
jgi:D-alanyl-D-alanine carboxypeptidase